jgi:Domain of unknown function (DUF4126)
MIETLALALGAAWASGINVYATVLMLGLLEASGVVVLPPELRFLAEPPVLMLAGFLYTVEFVADKTPGVDSGWDALHTFVRVPVGAALAATLAGGSDPGLAVLIGAVGGALAALSHLLKAGARVLINASPEPFSNWGASLGEDVAAFAGLWFAVRHPTEFLGLLVLFVLLTAWALPKLWRGVRRLFAWLAERLEPDRHRRPGAVRPGTPRGRPAGPALLEDRRGT